jgi:hypothetical protein
MSLLPDFAPFDEIGNKKERVRLAHSKRFV